MLLKSGQDWTESLLDEIMNELEAINNELYQLDIYPNQIEIIRYEQMLDAYSNTGGLPVLYSHWSFGEEFARKSELYKKGEIGLALEIVLNTNPALVYCMEENSAVAQATVLAHAGFGHNTVYKNNFFFKQWTDASSIIDYLVFAKNYVTSCEEKYGVKEVEKILDAAHALQFHGIDKYKRPPRLTKEEKFNKNEEREKFLQARKTELWNSVTEKSDNVKKEIKELLNTHKSVKQPQENLLYFLEKNAFLLKDWQREIIRIVRKIAQYFYPQMMMSLTHESAACFFHYKFMHELYNRGKITDDGMLEFYQLHSSVIFQPAYQRYPAINHYALGFAIFQDIERVSMNPTAEDREWFRGQEWVGNGDWLKNIKWVIENFKDDSLVLQFLSPKVIKDQRLFLITDDDEVSKDYRTVTAIHDERGYKKIRAALAKKYNIASMVPNIQVVDVDYWGDRSLYVEHVIADRRPLHNKSAEATLEHLTYLWGYPVLLQSVDKVKNDVVAEWESTPDPELQLDLDLSEL